MSIRSSGGQQVIFSETDKQKVWSTSRGDRPGVVRRESNLLFCLHIATPRDRDLKRHTADTEFLRRNLWVWDSEQTYTRICPDVVERHVMRPSSDLLRYSWYENTPQLAAWMMNMYDKYDIEEGKLSKYLTFYTLGLFALGTWGLPSFPCSDVLINAAPDPDSLCTRGNIQTCSESFYIYRWRAGIIGDDRQRRAEKQACFAHWLTHPKINTGVPLNLHIRIPAHNRRVCVNTKTSQVSSAKSCLLRTPTSWTNQGSDNPTETTITGVITVIVTITVCNNYIWCVVGGLFLSLGEQIESKKRFPLLWLNKTSRCMLVQNFMPEVLFNANKGE